MLVRPVKMPNSYCFNLYLGGTACKTQHTKGMLKKVIYIEKGNILEVWQSTSCLSLEPSIEQALVPYAMNWTKAGSLSLQPQIILRLESGDPRDLIHAVGYYKNTQSHYFSSFQAAGVDWWMRTVLPKKTKQRKIWTTPGWETSSW